MPTDYRPTVFLPKTDFPMRGDLPNREPVILARWEEMGLYKKLREVSRGREKFAGRCRCRAVCRRFRNGFADRYKAFDVWLLLRKWRHGPILRLARHHPLG